MKLTLNKLIYTAIVAILSITGSLQFGALYAFGLFGLLMTLGLAFRFGEVQGRGIEDTLDPLE